MPKKLKARLFASMPQCSQVLKISLELLRKAKRIGCVAFRANGSIDEAELLKFFSKHAEELKAKPKGERAALTLRDQKLNEEIRRLKNRNDRDEGKVIPLTLVCSRIQEALAGTTLILRQTFENEYPSQVAGLDAPQCRVLAKRAIDKALAKIQGLSDGWT